MSAFFKMKKTYCMPYIHSKITTNKSYLTLTLRKNATNTFKVGTFTEVFKTVILGSYYHCLKSNMSSCLLSTTEIVVTVYDSAVVLICEVKQ